MRIELDSEEFIAVRRFAAHADPDDIAWNPSVEFLSGSHLNPSLLRFAELWRAEPPCWQRIEVRQHAVLADHSYYVLEVPDDLVQWFLGQMDYWGNRELFHDVGLHIHAWNVADRIRHGALQVAATVKIEE